MSCSSLKRGTMARHIVAQSKEVHTTSKLLEMPCPASIREYDGKTLDERYFFLEWDLQRAACCPYTRAMLLERMTSRGMALTPK